MFIPDPYGILICYPSRMPDPGVKKAGSRIRIRNTDLLCRVSMSSVFPGREKDWVEFGTFLYEDERTIQTFKNEEGILGKYIKVSLYKKSAK
jgi:hypothetical protein